MADDPISSIGMINNFKKKINYSEIKSKVVDDTRVLINWPDSLREIIIQGESWRSFDNSIWIQGRGHAVISDYYESGSSIVNLKIHVFSNKSNGEVLDESIRLLSMTSSMNISYIHLKSSPDTFYLYVPHVINEVIHKKVKCVYKNVIIEASTSQEETDVKPVVEYLVSRMKKTLVDKSNYASINYKVSISPYNVRVAEPFTINIDYPDRDKSSYYKVSIQEDILPDGFEYIDNTDNSYKLVTNNAGMFKIEVWILNINTLQSAVTFIEMNVK